MTESKPSIDKFSKALPKKAVSFSRKFVAPRLEKGLSEGSLQCGDKRRRYLRRGSKTPIMMLNQSGNFRKALEEFTLDELKSRLFDDDMNLHMLLTTIKISSDSSSDISERSSVRPKCMDRRHSMEIFSRFPTSPQRENL